MYKMNKQVSFALPEESVFKSDQYTKADLKFKITQLEQQILRLQQRNAELHKVIEKSTFAELAKEDYAKDINTAIALGYEPAEEQSPRAFFWGARYKSKNPDVKDIEIPEDLQPDHCLTKDNLQYFVIPECNHEQPDRPPQNAIENKRETVIRKLILGRERVLSCECGKCGKDVKYRMIEKHMEADFFVEDFS